MSTKKTAEKAAACAGCEKRDATIKRQAEENTGLRGTANYWNVEWCKAMQLVRNLEGERDALTAQRDTLQARIDSFIKTCADIRSVCVGAGIEHADKMATLTAVKALAENAKRYKVADDSIGRLRDAMTADTNTFVLTKSTDGRIRCVRKDTPTTAERPSVMPLVILALNLAILGRLLTM